jgi:transposase-like protein
MARKRKSPSNPRGQYRGKPMTGLQKESIVQTYALCGNKREVARQLGVSYPTVLRVLKDAENDTQLQKARSRAMEDLAGKVQAKTNEVLESITPEDMESGLIKKYDDDGNLVSVKGYGPSLMQKVTSAAILTDKMKVIQETKQVLESDRSQDPTALPLPQDVQAAVKQIGERVKRLQILDIQFHDRNPEVAEKLQEVAVKASLDERITDADFEELDFDNPEE